MSDDFNPATIADDTIYIGSRKYVAADLPATNEQIAADPRVHALVEALERIAEMKPHRAGQTADEYHMQEIVRAALAQFNQEKETHQ